MFNGIFRENRFGKENVVKVSRVNIFVFFIFLKTNNCYFYFFLSLNNNYGKYLVCFNTKLCEAQVKETIKCPNLVFFKGPQGERS